MEAIKRVKEVSRLLLLQFGNTVPTTDFSLDSRPMDAEFFPGVLDPSLDACFPLCLYLRLDFNVLAVFPEPRDVQADRLGISLGENAHDRLAPNRLMLVKRVMHLPKFPRMQS